MKLIVGLGNPGREYEDTRHNMGFFYLDAFAKQKNIKIDKKKFGGIYCEFIEDKEKIFLLKPQTYINLSGESIKKFIDFYKITLNDLLIICDDLDTTFGKYKLKSNGSSGGHNGLKNIELVLGTQQYNRLKIGISNDKMMETRDYVLSKLDGESAEIRDQNKDIICNIIDDFCHMNFDELMSKYNRK